MKRLLVFCLFSLACTASTCAGIQPTPTPQATAATACDNLSKLGCADGTAPNCVQMLQKIIDDHMTTVNLSCLTAAGSIPAAVACGAVVCE